MARLSYRNPTEYKVFCIIVLKSLLKIRHFGHERERERDIYIYIYTSDVLSLNSDRVK